MTIHQKVSKIDHHVCRLKNKIIMKFLFRMPRCIKWCLSLLPCKTYRTAQRNSLLNSFLPSRQHKSGTTSKVFPTCLQATMQFAAWLPTFSLLLFSNEMPTFSDETPTLSHTFGQNKAHRSSSFGRPCLFSRLILGGGCTGNPALLAEKGVNRNSAGLPRHYCSQIITCKYTGWLGRPLDTVSLPGPSWWMER